jgi:hypothetical protein
MNVRLPVDLYSADQLGAVILELRDYVAALRDNQVRRRAGHTVEETPHVSALLLGVLHGAGAKQDELAPTESVLSDIEVLRSKAMVAHVTLAALPNRTLKRQLVVWFRSQVNPYAFLTFAMRSDIGGGVIVQAGSHIYDYSFRQVLVGNRQRLAELAANV